MHLGVLQFELLILGASSLKDKRRVVRSVKDRLHREHQVSVAEVRYLERMNVAGMALALVNRDASYVARVLDTIRDKLRATPDAELGDCWREIVSADQLPGAFLGDDGSPLWTPEEARESIADAGAEDIADTASDPVSDRGTDRN